MTKTLKTALNVEFQWTLRFQSSLELVFRGRTEGNVLETPWTKNVPNADKVYWNPAFWSVKPDTLDVSTQKNGRGVRLRGHAERFGAFLVQLFGHRKSLQDWNSISCRLLLWRVRFHQKTPLGGLCGHFSESRSQVTYTPFSHHDYSSSHR